ncbi:dihydrofolate reductase family protein [Luteipulveratus flavus]|uniref:Dihydrofolate reductase family protein n=1 Tax=Luteipulveratus flavus TaxID=3031728 RepID=A0ABT6C8E4_9MICO|nr:dihydrofolate reductase family protein [Luteipulveratus sp. YIM 133296]MDF8265201.1 dihydrofolate reductase family protein [Luteipulveratus sp. YIM 133296]
MSARVVADLSVTLDGVAAGHDQSLDHPFGPRIGERLHTWMFEHAADNAAEVEAITAASAYVMGRNTFSPGRGAWDPDWRGWWGDDPPYHAPVFVLTHHERDPLPMDGGTTFTFVTGGLEEALRRAREAAGDGDVAIAGGASTVNACLAAGVLDELRLHVAPITAGDGVRIFEGVPDLQLRPVASRTTPYVTHLTWVRPA